MGLLKLYLKTETARLIHDGIRLSVIGRRAGCRTALRN